MVSVVSRETVVTLAALRLRHLRRFEQIFQHVFWDHLSCDQNRHDPSLHRDKSWHIEPIVFFKIMEG